VLASQPVAVCTVELSSSPFGAIIIMDVRRYRHANRDRGPAFGAPLPVLVMPVLDMPCDGRCPIVVLAVVLAIVMPALCLVICSGGRSLHRRVSSCIVDAHRRARSRCHIVTV